MSKKPDILVVLMFVFGVGILISGVAQSALL
jgi:hypothetical protein